MCLLRFVKIYSKLKNEKKLNHYLKYEIFYDILYKERYGVKRDDTFEP